MKVKIQRRAERTVSLCKCRIFVLKQERILFFKHLRVFGRLPEFNVIIGRLVENQFHSSCAWSTICLKQDKRQLEYHFNIFV